jgi:hypothetical protein
MPIFAGAVGNLLEIAIFLVIGGIMAINKILAARREEPQQPRRVVPRPVSTPRAAPPPPRPAPMSANPMEPQDVDQFLDEVLGRGQAVPQRPPAAGRPVVILRPTEPPPVPQARPQPEPRRPVVRPAIRPAIRPVVPRPARTVREAVPVPPQETKTRSKFSESVQKDVDKAAAATSEAADLTQRKMESIRSEPPASSIGAMLRNPAEIRRAILIREILGPPLALRRQRKM